MTPVELTALLYRCEGDGLDFKSQQYDLNGDREQKSKLIKDVLAMANAWHPGERYIIIGAIEKPAPPAELCAVSMHPNDADVQQLVDGGKLNRRLSFAYETIQVDGLVIGVVRVPQQKRPFYLKSDYAVAKQGVVYVRRNSSTTIADPDEVASMGAMDNGPLETPPDLAVEECVSVAGDEHDYPCVKIHVLEEIDSVPSRVLRPERSHQKFPFVVTNADSPAYLLQLAKWYRDYLASAPLKFRVSNRGASLAKNVRLEVRIQQDCVAAVESQLALLNRRPLEGMRAKYNAADTVVSAISRDGDDYVIQFKLGDLQPGATTLTDGDTLVRDFKCSLMELRCAVYGDNLAVPVKWVRTIGFLSEFDDWTDKHFEDMRKLPLVG